MKKKYEKEEFQNVNTRILLILKHRFLKNEVDCSEKIDGYLCGLDELEKRGHYWKKVFCFNRRLLI